MNWKATASTQALGRMKTGDMNKTEARYAQHLDMLKAAGQVLWWKFEGVKLRLADATFYSPDFSVVSALGELQMHEVKGFWHDDAKVKIKVAAAMYPFRFIAVMAKKQGWEVTEF